MEQPSNINLYDYPAKNAPLNLPPPSPNNVRGWLLGVHGYRDSPPNILPRSQQDTIGTDNLIAATNLSYNGDAMERRKSISSLASEDSELSDYQSLVVNQKPKDMEYIDKSLHHLHLDSPELSWSPPDDDDEPIETLSPLAHNTTTTRHRSGSINSDHSLNSYSTVTVHQYSRYGMTPMIYQSDSTSTSSRTPSRLSNYSTSSQTSSNATTTLPRPRKVSATSTSGMPSPSRSFTTRDETHLLPRAHSRLGTCHLPTANSNAATSNNTTRSKLAKRASHIPAPSSISASPPPSTKSISRPTTIPSSRSTGIPGGRVPDLQCQDHVELPDTQ
ncbi:hypothetical protein [Absidia glauca]|uniref:Uncharacterized protein n=1 Tax=Absidia glauca TaxID=4829 RepID=A0A168Q7U0_ABSGL|nr:hypothetical protein [Absidia glauca]